MKSILLILYSYFFSLFSSMISTKPKLCINCKFLIKDFFVVNATEKCSLFPKVEKEKYDRFFLMDGGISIEKTDFQYCNISREYEELCGKEGNFYKEK